MEVDFSLPAERVIRSLDSILEWRGKPGTIRVDNGPDYIREKLRKWLSNMGLPSNISNPAHSAGKQSAGLFSDPPHTQQNAYIERYNRTVRHEWLDQYIIESIEPYGDCGQSPTGQREAQDHATQWLWTYNNDRPNIPFMVCRQTIAGQRGIGGITPAQKLKMAA